MNINIFTYLNILKITVMIERNKENKTIKQMIELNQINRQKEEYL